MLESAAATPSPGDWLEVTFEAGSRGSLWEQATVRHGGGGGRGAVSVLGDTRLTLRDVTFVDNRDCDISREQDGVVFDLIVEATPFADCP